MGGSLEKVLGTGSALQELLQPKMKRQVFEVGEEEECVEMKSWRFSSRSSFVSTATFFFVSCVVEIYLSQWLRMKSRSSSWMSLLDTSKQLLGKVAKH